MMKAKFKCLRFIFEILMINKKLLIIFLCLLLQSCAFFVEKHNSDLVSLTVTGNKINKLYLVVGSAYENSPNKNIHDFQFDLNTKSSFAMGGTSEEDGRRDAIASIQNKIKELVHIEEIIPITKDEINKYENVLLINQLIEKPSRLTDLRDNWNMLSFYSFGVIPSWRKNKISYFSKLYKNGKEVKSYTLSESYLSAISIVLLPASPFYSIKDVDKLREHTLEKTISLIFR